MFEQTLQEIGLSPNEAKIYEALLKVKSSNVSNLAVKAKVHRRNVYDCISKLIEKGLVSELIVNNEKQYKAVNPNRLLNLIKDKETILLNAMPEMQKKFEKIKTEEKAYVYKGIQGFKNYMQDILDVGEDVYCIDAKGGWWDNRLEPFRTRFYNQLDKKKIKVHTLFDYEMKEKMPNVTKKHKHEAKFLPKKYTTNSAIDIFGDHIVIFTGLEFGKLDEDITQFVIISKELAESYKTWHKMIWDLLP